MSKSNYLESKILRHIINAATYTPPASLWLALYTTDPTDADVGTEMTGGSPAYARKQITFGTEANGTVANSAAVSVNVPTGQALYWAVRDAVTGGNLMYHGPFETPIDTTSGTPLVFAIGDITLTEK